MNQRYEGVAIELIRKLTTTDGWMLRCFNPARPTRDCIFSDPRPGKFFKVFNRNAVSGMVGLFNVTTRASGYDKLFENTTALVKSRTSNEAQKYNLFLLWLVHIGVVRLSTMIGTEARR